MTASSLPDQPDRAECVAAIRDLAQWIEDHPEVPAPQMVDAQYSLLSASPDNADVVRELAEQLGVEPRIGAGATSLKVRLVSGFPLDVKYIVHGRLTEDEDGGWPS